MINTVIELFGKDRESVFPNYYKNRSVAIKHFEQLMVENGMTKHIRKEYKKKTVVEDSGYIVMMLLDGSYE